MDGGASAFLTNTCDLFYQQQVELDISFMNFCQKYEVKVDAL